MFQFLSIGGAIAVDLEDGLFDLFDGHVAGVDEEGVDGLPEGRFAARRVALVAFADLTNDAVDVRLVSAGFEVMQAARGSHIEAGVEIDLDVGVGKDVRSDVPALHDHALPRSHLALFLDKGAPHGGHGRDFRSGSGDLLGADEGGDVLAVEEDGAGRGEFDDSGESELFEAVAIGEIRVRAHGPEGNGAVHGSGVDVQESEALREAPGDGALACSGGAVDGKDNLTGRHANRSF